MILPIAEHRKALAEALTPYDCGPHSLTPTGSGIDARQSAYSKECERPGVLTIVTRSY